MLGTTTTLLKEVRIVQLDAEIIRLAKEFLKEPICPANEKYHTAILEEQCTAIRELKKLKS